MMQAKLLYIIRCMALLSAVLLTACSSSGEEENSATVEDCFLDIYVYSPGRPIVTRGDVGEIAPSAEAERKVNTLQIWVFKHADGSLVSYKGEKPTFLNEEAIGQQKFQMKIDKTFADNPENVDVYVVANAKSCGLSSLDEKTTRAQLDEAQINGDYFGTSTLTHAVPDRWSADVCRPPQPTYHGPFPHAPHRHRERDGHAAAHPRRVEAALRALQDNGGYKYQETTRFY